jgi:hypothetical protein
VQLLSTKEGIPVEFAFLPGEANDTRGIKALPFNIPSGSSIYADAGYTDYLSEDDLKLADDITLQVMRKRNSQRPDAPWVAYLKQVTRHYIETVFSASSVIFFKGIIFPPRTPSFAVITTLAPASSILEARDSLEKPAKTIE